MAIGAAAEGREAVSLQVPKGGKDDLMSIGPAQKAELIDRIYSHRGLPNAVDKCGLNLREVMEEIDDDKDFAAQVDKALNHLTAIGEQELFRRAVEGVESHVVSQGKLVYAPVGEDEMGLPIMIPLMERKYSDGLLDKFMKARARTTFGDKLEVEHHHRGHIAVPVISQEALLAALESGSPLDFTPQAVLDAEYTMISDGRQSEAVADDEPDFGDLLADSEREESLKALAKIMGPPEDDDDLGFGI